MISTKARNALLLGGILLCFFGLGGILVYHAYQTSQRSFVTGAPPIDIKNSLLPENIDPAKMRPPAIRPTDPIRFGSVTSVASVIVFGDFECESCKAVDDVVRRVLPSYRGNVRFVWRDLPVTDVNPSAMDAAIFARCAGLQGKFWEAHDALYRVKTLNELAYNAISSELQLNSGQLQACRRDPAVRQAIQQDIDTARNDGVNSAPFLFIGTKAWVGPITVEQLQSDIKLYLGS